MAFCSFFFTACSDLKHMPFNTLLTLGNKKVTYCKLRQVGCMLQYRNSMLCQNYTLINSALCASVLSWWRVHKWFFHMSGLFLSVHSWRFVKTALYIWFTLWHSATYSMRMIPQILKKLSSWHWILTWSMICHMLLSKKVGSISVFFRMSVGHSSFLLISSEVFGHFSTHSSC